MAANIAQAQGNGGGTSVGRIADSVRARNFDQALQLSQAALKTTPQDYRIWTLRGMAYTGEGNVAQALDCYHHALVLKADYLPALEGAAETEYRRGSTDARPLILQVLSQRPNDPTSHAMLGFFAYRENKCSEAVSHFEQAKDVLAQQPAALAAYGSCLAGLGRCEEAVPIFQQALSMDPSMDPSSHAIRFNLALALQKGNHHEDALGTLQPLMDTPPVGEDVLLLAADIYESSNDTQQAITLLRKAILSNPKRVDAYLDFAFLSYDHASAQVGIDILNAGLTQLPRDAQLHLVRGILYAQLSRFGEATEDFDAANAVDPNLSFTGLATGLVESQEHKSNEALGTFRAATKAHPDDALAQYMLAEALLQEGKVSGTPEYSEAVAAARRAAQQDPKLAAAHDLLATIYLQGGETELALQQSRLALAVDPNDQQAIYHLILLLRKTAQKNEIPALLKRLMELRNNAQADAAQNKRYQLEEIPFHPSL